MRESSGQTLIRDLRKADNTDEENPVARSVTNTEKSTILVVAVTGEHTRMINDDVKKRSTEPVGSM
jgi:hypothetical protein